MERLLLTPVEVARALAIARSRVYALIGDGVIPSVRIGKSVRVPKDALQAWIANRTGRESEVGT